MRQSRRHRPSHAAAVPPVRHGRGQRCHRGVHVRPVQRHRLPRPRAAPSTATGSASSTSPTSRPPSLGDAHLRRVRRWRVRQAARLDELGIEVGDRVAVISHNSARLLTSFFGVCGSGRVLVPINFRLRPDEVAYIVSTPAPACSTSTPSSTRSLAGVDVEHRFVLGDDDDDVRRRGRRAARRGSRTRTPPPRINYTSGTTARPKGVQLTHRNIWTNAVTFGCTPASPTATSTCTRCRCSTPTAGACRSR